MKASTPEKALLRFLYLLAEAEGESKFHKYEDLVKEMREIDSKDNCGFGHLLTVWGKGRAIGLNVSLSLVEYNAGEQTIKLTSLGAALGSRLCFFPEFEEAVGKYYGK